MIRNILLAGVMALCLGATALADNIGKTLPEASIEGFTQSKAANMEELTGRVVFIEFFAYW